MAFFGFGGRRKGSEGGGAGESSSSYGSGLERTRSGFLGKLTRVFTNKTRVDDEVLDRLEEVLIASDVGVATTLKIVRGVEARAKSDGYSGSAELGALVRSVVLDLFPTGGRSGLEEIPEGGGRPYLILVVGVNGVGKTTTIGKLASRYREMGHGVVLGAADTFRAAAVDQLRVWSERAEVELVERPMGSDPASVAYAAAERARDGGFDVGIVDTAGRLHNKVNLMNELGKIKRAIGKVVEGAPHEVFLILDASTGQNAYEQARQFMSVTEITGLVLTKLDGTARGGVALGISDQLGVPIRYIGLGEGIGDLQPFDARAFVESLFEGFDGREG